MLPPELRSFIICDDIRRDQYGKDFIIGVFPQEPIITPEMPFDMPLALWVEHHWPIACPAKFHIRVSYNEYPPFPLTISFNSSEPGTYITPITGLRLRGTSDGVARFEYSKDENDWTIVREVHIKKGQFISPFHVVPIK
jgi:hypothetical protein